MPRAISAPQLPPPFWYSLINGRPTDDREALSLPAREREAQPLAGNTAARWMC
jgi:hypothetical protein